ncbi:MAG: sensor histidine kinase [Bacillales bacterium]
MTIGNKHKNISINWVFILPSVFLFLFFTAVMSITTYSNFYYHIRKENIKQVNLISQSILKNYNQYFTNVLNTTNNIQSKIENNNLYNVDTATKTINYLDFLIESQKDMISCVLYELDGDYILSDNKYLDKNSKDKIDTNLAWFKSALDHPLIDNFSYLSYQEDSYNFIISKLISFNYGKNNAVLRIEYDFTALMNLISKKDLGDNGNIILYDSDYNIFFKYNYNEINESALNELKDLVLGIKNIKIDNKDYILYASTISRTTWRFALLIDNSTIKVPLNNFLITTFTMGIMIIILFVFLISIIGHSITKPIRQLEKDMNDIVNLDFVYKERNIDFRTKEIKSLANSYNQMTKRIKELTDSLIFNEKEKRKSELKALQNQINPHFLYNTFDSIVYMIDINEDKIAKNMIISLSNFFRISVSKGKNIIPIKKEIEHVKYYLDIQKMRYGNNFNYEIIYDNNLDSFNVIKLILQPIVENSILHGINLNANHNDKKGFIQIRVIKKTKYIYFEITDNGYGMLPEKISEIYKSLNNLNQNKYGIGIRNVYNRLKIYYGEKASILIKSKLDEFTKFIIKIPINYGVQNEEK